MSLPKISPTRVLPLLAAVLLGPIGASQAVAQTVSATTDPVGFITLAVPGTGGTAQSRLSFQGLGLTRPIEYQGAAESASGTTIVDTQSQWTDDQYNGAAGEYYVEIMGGGVAEGTIYDIADTSASAHSLILAQPLPSGIPAGVVFKVRKHWTLASVFGDTNSAGLGGGNASTADQINIYNGSTYAIYYYSTGGLTGVGWRKAGSNANQANTVLRPDDGILISRQQSSAANVTLTGAVKTAKSSYPVFPGVNILPNPYAAPMTLGSSGFYTGNPSTGVAAGSSSTADQVVIYNGATYEIFYYSSGGLVGTGWRKAGDSPANTNRDSVLIPVGSSFLLIRNASAGFDWSSPQHPASL